MDVNGKDIRSSSCGSFSFTIPLLLTVLLEHTLQHLISLQLSLVPMNAHCRPPETDTHGRLAFLIIIHYSTVITVLLILKIFKCYQLSI